MSPSVKTKGTSNTECLVFIHTHDRGPKAPSQKFDISKYITAVNVGSHLDGGGFATISLPAIDHIENIIASGDVVNIYFNTHRGDSNLYNRGYVRTFFGYVFSVAKSVSVAEEGKKITTYSISCKDFSKAIRNTQIYNNEHLASQSKGHKYGVVRADMGTNLGGVALLSRGIALQGTPRQIVLQNLMRFLGFGGQWALPISYDEKLPDASHAFAPSTSGGRVKALSSLQAVFIQVLASTDETVKQELVDALLALSKVVKKSKGKHSVSQLWEAVYTQDESINVGEAATKVEELQTRYKPLYYDIKEVAAGGVPSQINNTFFKITGITEDEGFGKIGRQRTVGGIEQGLKADLHAVLDRVVNEIEAVNPKTLKESVGGFPKDNLYAQRFDSDKNNLPIRTIFNILCLDYLENVGGFWANFGMLGFQGTLMSALKTGSNHTMNELFFDLRPSPEFKPLAKDGLGTPLDGAIPMVPAVVLRRKPFTNYQKPNSEISNADIDGDMIVGGYKLPGAGGMSDQLVINSGGSLGALGATTVSGKDIQQVKDTLKEFKTGVSTSSIKEVIKEKTVTSPTKKRRKRRSPVSPSKAERDAVKAWAKKMDELGQEAAKTGTNPNDSLLEMSTLTNFQTATPSQKTSYITSTEFSSEVKIAKKALASFITLPRPIFRSPDKNRITKELDIAQTQHVLGYLQTNPDTKKTTFFAFGGGTKAGSGVKASSSNEAYDIGLDPLTQQLSQAISNIGPRTGHSVNDSAMLMKGSSMETLNTNLSGKHALQNKEDDYLNKTEADKVDWHVLDYMAIDSSDVMSEDYTRGDFDVRNFIEYFGATMGGFEAQRLFLGTVMPIITPISVYRFGVRVWSESTEHVQALLSGATDHLYEKNILLRWVILQDMWNQHNHELLGGGMLLRGMPGLRPGYRLDRVDLNLSFYVEQVSHSWSHPGHLSTQVGVSRGQPSGGENALRYERPTPSTPAYESERQELGKVFDTAKFKRGGKEHSIGVPGTYTGPDGIGKQIKVESRPENPQAASLGDIVTLLDED